MSEPKRNEKGQYVKGSSGNSKGAKEKLFAPDPRLPASRRRAIMDVADRKFEMKIDGSTQKVSLFEANVWQLAMSGAKGNRVAAQSFIDLAMTTSRVDLESRVKGHQILARANRVERELEELRARTATRDNVVVDPNIMIETMEDARKWAAENGRLDDEANAARIIATMRARAFGDNPERGV